MIDYQKIKLCHYLQIAAYILCGVLVSLAIFFFWKTSQIDISSKEARVQELRAELQQKQELVRRSAEPQVPSGVVSASTLPSRSATIDAILAIASKYRDRYDIKIRFEQESASSPQVGILAPTRYRVVISEYYETAEVLAFARELAAVAQLVSFRYGEMQTFVSQSDQLLAFQTEIMEQTFDFENAAPTITLVIEIYGN